MSDNKPMYYDGSVPINAEQLQKNSDNQTVIKPEGVTNNIKFPYYPYN